MGSGAISGLNLGTGAICRLNLGTEAISGLNSGTEAFSGLKVGVNSGAEDQRKETDFSADRTNVNTGSSTFAPRSLLLGIFFRARGDTGGQDGMEPLERHVEGELERLHASGKGLNDFDCPH